MATITLSYSAPSTTYNIPWNVYLYKANTASELLDLVPGQEVTNITYVGVTPVEPGTGVGSILSFVYENGADLFLEPAAGRTLIGLIIIDSNGTLLKPDDGSGGGRGDITLTSLAQTPDEKNKECFDKLVWDKQCTFAKDVLKFVNQISFGYFKPEALECLKNEKRALEILNAYDTRDIENETTNYNVFTYKQIKKLLK